MTMEESNTSLINKIDIKMEKNVQRIPSIHDEVHK